MSLFVVTHRHSADVCPAGHPKMGPMLLRHVSKSNANQHGINILAEAVVEGQHTLQLILEANDGQKVEEFMAPFAQMGSVDVLPANPCEVVVSRGKC